MSGMQAGFQQVSSGSALVHFEKKWVPNEFKTRVEGRPVGEYRDFIRIIFPGETQSIMDREVKPEDTQRFPREWAAYQNNQEQIPDGTPVEEWPGLKPSEVQMLRANNIRTIEQLGEMPDVNLQTIMGGYRLRERARTFLTTMVRASRETHVVEGEKGLLQIAVTMETEAANAVVVVDSDVNDAHGKLTVIEDNIREAKAVFDRAVELHKGEIERHTKALQDAETNYKGVVASLTASRETWQKKLADWKARHDAAVKAASEHGPGSQTMVQPPQAPPVAPPIEVPQYATPTPMEPVAEIRGSEDGGDPTADPAFFDRSFKDGDEGVAAAQEAKPTPKPRGRPKGSKTRRAKK